MAFLLHRWLGIGLGLLMAVWAVSGIVMMYVAFPDTTVEERIAGLEPLAMAACCAPDTVSALAGETLDGAAVEMLGGRPVLRWSGLEGPQVRDLASGRAVQVDEGLAAFVARTHLVQTRGRASPVTIDTFARDQWTVYGQFRQHQPLFKATIADDAGSVFYISGTTGEVVQDTTAHERFWNWLGAVPHWLYFTVLREVQWLWYDVVVYASVLGTFLTVTGIYVGLRQYGRGKRRSPYRGLALWHHWTGLIFGVLTLTWVVSGLFSMQPWGWFESEGPGREVAQLAGRPAQAQDVAALLDSLRGGDTNGAVRAELALQDGQAVAILADPANDLRRAALPSLATDTPDEAELAARAQAAMPGIAIASQALLTAGDAYHYAHKDAAIGSAWRAIYRDEGETRLYFDPRTGEIIRKVDAAGRAYRWLHYGLHRLDFGGLGAIRPAWDIVTLPLMLGVPLLCLIGFWLGIRRLRR